MSDQEIKVVDETSFNLKLFGTNLIILSGVILYLDKIFTYYGVEITNLHGWPDQENYIWSLTQTISPVLIMIGLYYKAFKLSLLVPLCCYILQFYFVLDDKLTVDRSLTWIYVVSTIAATVLVVVLLKRLISRRDVLYTLRINLMNKIISKDDELLKPNQHDQ